MQTTVDANPTTNPVNHHGRRLVVETVTESGGRFRPSDWVERLASSFTSFDGRRLRYTQGVTPSFLEGRKCLVVDADLEQRSPEAYRFITDFVARNALRHHWEESHN